MRIQRFHLVMAASMILALSFTSCKKDSSITTDSMYVPASADVTASATLSDLQNGRTLYINNCAGCHSLYIPESYTPSQWSSILPNMTPKTSLTASEVALVKKYVTKGKL